ncbi:hypothetical protein EL22_26205 [Halostagnicola sp. A56]|nr:hypothetical protein EL22_26205 [Halostagnicola sp. A56]
MRTRDIERLEAQFNRLTQAAADIIEDSRTVDDSGFDISSSDSMLERQQEFGDEISQALANIDALSVPDRNRSSDSSLI